MTRENTVPPKVLQYDKFFPHRHRARFGIHMGLCDLLLCLDGREAVCERVRNSASYLLAAGRSDPYLCFFAAETIRQSRLSNGMFSDLRFALCH